MAVFTLNDDWQIASDSYAWMVQRRNKGWTYSKKNPSPWETVTWHTDAGQAARSYADRSLRTSDAEGFEAIRARLDELETEIRAAFGLDVAA